MRRRRIFLPFCWTIGHDVKYHRYKAYCHRCHRNLPKLNKERGSYFR